MTAYHNHSPLLKKDEKSQVLALVAQNLSEATKDKCKVMALRLCNLFAIPYSKKFLALDEDEQARLKRLASVINPNLLDEKGRIQRKHPAIKLS